MRLTKYKINGGEYTAQDTVNITLVVKDYNIQYLFNRCRANSIAYKITNTQYYSEWHCKVIRITGTAYNMQMLMDMLHVDWVEYKTARICNYPNIWNIYRNKTDSERVPIYNGIVYTLKNNKLHKEYTRNANAIKADKNYRNADKIHVLPI